MSFFRLLSAARARLVLRPATHRRGPEQESGKVELDPAEEFQKVQRGLRRLSLASDRSAGLLDGMVNRLDEIQQTLLEMRRPAQRAVSLEEAALLHVLDRLDLALEAPQLSVAALSTIESARNELLAAVRWEAVAVLGARPDGTGIRIADLIDPEKLGARGEFDSDARGESDSGAHAESDSAAHADSEARGGPGPGGVARAPAAEARIERVLEQGYRRPDGSLLRPAVVVAARVAEPPLNRHDSA